MKKAAIIHGTKGSPDGNWFQDIAVQLREHGYETFIPQFPTPEGQGLDTWLTHFEKNVGEIGRASILIGHSVGAVFVLRLLERLSSPVAAAVMVAGFTGALGLPEYDELNASFVATPLNWQIIRSNAAQFICISGEKDPYVPSHQGEEIATSLGVPHHIIRHGGHLNTEFGYTKFPQLIEEMTKSGVFGKIKNKSSGAINRPLT